MVKKLLNVKSPFIEIVNITRLMKRSLHDSQIDSTIVAPALKLDQGHYLVSLIGCLTDI